MAFVPSMALRTPSSFHISSLAPRITSAILHSSNSKLRFASGSPKLVSMDPVSSPKSGSRAASVQAQPRDEEAAAKVAAATVDPAKPTIFDKIISKEIPATIVYETEKVLAFRDINPQAPVHVVLIPKKRDGLTQLSKATEGNKDVLGELLYAAKEVAEQEGLQPDGFRVVINDGPNGCQSVYHLHLHLIGGRQLKWPPG